MQSLYREEIQESMGVGPWKSSKTKQISMIENGENTGKNFVNQFTFAYATSSESYINSTKSFIFNPNRLNVMISRAKTKVILFGSIAIQRYLKTELFR